MVMLASQTTKREPFTNPSWRPRGSERGFIYEVFFPNSLLDAGSASLPVCASRSCARIDDDDDDDDCGGGDDSDADMVKNTIILC